MKKSIKQFLLLLIIVIISFTLGCTFFPDKSKRWKPVKPGTQAFVHTVKWPEENFDIISKWYTGSVKHTEDIINANPTVDPEKLEIGNIVFIPNKLLRNKKELTQNYVKNFNKKQVKKTKKKKKVEKKPDQKDKFELFGPR